jgi:F-type H+-transporting ATPase subunit epsilon
MKLDIVTPLGRIFEGEVKEAYFPGIEGEFGVLDGHAPLMTTLIPGIITIKKEDGSKEVIAINSGYVEVTPGYTNVLVDGAEPISGDSSGDIAKAIERAKKLVREATNSNAIVASVEAKIESVARSI